MDNKVNYQFKVLYFLGILFIVFGHCGYNGGAFFSDWFPYYSFHLGLFVFCSGYFFKKSDTEHVLKYIWKKFKKLIIPVYIWNFVYGIIVLLLKNKGFTIGGDFTLYNLFIAPINDGHQFMYNLSSWFIIPLFMILVFNIIFYKISKRININDWFILIIYFILGMIGVHLSIKGYNTGSWLVLVRFLFLLPFYGLGIIYKSKLETKDKLSNEKYFIILFILQLIIFTIFKRVIAYTPSWCNNFDNVFLPFIVGIIGIAFWLRISRILTPLLKDKKYINIIADNTYSIMIHHLFGFMILKTIFALLSHHISDFSNFDFVLYKTDIWYMYLPYNLYIWLLVYALIGILYSLGIKYVINKIKKIVIKKNL